MSHNCPVYKLSVAQLSVSELSVRHSVSGHKIWFRLIWSTEQPVHEMNMHAAERSTGSHTLNVIFLGGIQCDTWNRTWLALLHYNSLLLANWSGTTWSKWSCSRTPCTTRKQTLDLTTSSQPLTIKSHMPSHPQNMYQYKTGAYFNDFNLIETAVISIQNVWW